MFPGVFILDPICPNSYIFSSVILSKIWQLQKAIYFCPKLYKAMAKENEENKPREWCAHCKKKRYKEFMAVVFTHPGIGEVWACSRAVKSWLNFPDCYNKTIQNLMMYQNTGALVLTYSPEYVAANKKPGKK